MGYFTALRRVKGAGLHRRRAARRTLLTNRVREQRMQFCRFMLSPIMRGQWENIIFTDEKTFCSDRNNVRYVYRPSKQRFNERYVAHGSRSGRTSVHYWGWMSHSGLGLLHETGPNHDSESYTEILNDFVEDVPIICGRTLSELIFQQDNSPVHTSRESSRFVQSLGFRLVLIWPPYSPDINIIENIWAIVESMRPQSTQELKILITRIWDELRGDIELVHRLYASLERRFQYILDHNGDWSV